MFRGRGYIYSALVLILDMLIGGWFGFMVATLTAVYAFFIGEWYAKKKYGAISCNASFNNQRDKLQRCFLRVSTKANQKYGHMPKSIKIYIVPDQKIQAYAFGWRSIGVTEGALNLDARTLEALIAHEYGHIVNGDSVLNMALSANAIGLVALLAFYQFALIAVVYLIVIIACLFGLFKFNFLSYMVTTKLTGLFKKIGEIVQRGAFHLFQIIIKAFGRKGELMADSFACSLGYAFYLRRFLERFDIEAPRRETILDALYETHPPRDVRLRNPDMLQIDRR
jgi:Zn-dependent protease with chaperone function